MKNELKISTLTIVCALCATTISGAWAAPSVRTVGGAGTYNGASAASGGTAARAAAMRVTPTVNAAAPKATAGTASASTGRAAATSRLSLGKYLGAGKGISVSTDNPSGGSSSMNPGSATADAAELAEIRVELDKKQDALKNKDGYIEINDKGEISLLVDKLKTSLAGVDGKDVNIRNSDGSIQWQHDGDSEWTELFNVSELKGAKGDTGADGKDADINDIIPAMNAKIEQEVAKISLDDYAKKTEVYTKGEARQEFLTTDDLAGYATADALTNKVSKDDLSEYAKKSELKNVATSGDYNDLLNKPNLSGYATTAALDGKADKSELDGLAKSADVYTKTESDGKYATKAAIETLTGTVADINLDGYAKTADVNTALSQKANSADLATVATSGSYNDLADKPTIPSLDGYAKTADVNTALSGKADKSDLTGLAKTTDIPSLDGYAKTTDIPSLEGYAKTTDLPNMANYATKADLDSVSAGDVDLTNYYTKADVNAALSDKMDKVTLADVATSGSYNDLADKPTIPSLDGYAKTTDLPDMTQYATMESVTTINDTLTGLGETIAKAEQDATKALADAGTAQATADEAKTLAQSATTTVNTVNNNYNTIKEAVDKIDADKVATVTNTLYSTDSPVFINNENKLEIKDGSITAVKLGPKSVTNDKLADNAVKLANLDDEVSDQLVGKPESGDLQILLVDSDGNRIWADLTSDD